MRKPPQQTRRRQRRHQPRQRARAHFSENHALIFLAIVQPFYSSKPYHKSLHSCSLSLFRLVSRRHGRQASVCFVLIVFPRALSRSLLNQEKKQKKMEVRVVCEALFFSDSPLIRENSPESSQTTGIITFVYHLRRACFRFHDVSTGQDSLIHKKRASKSFEERKKHTPRRRRRIAKRK